MRWHPHGAEPGEPLAPGSFLSLAEESELIVQIGDWVLHAACAQAAAWRRDGIEIPVSVNISARELTGSDLAERVQEALPTAACPAARCASTSARRSILRDPARARTALKDVGRLGVAVALDNFGARQSTLSLPGSLPLNMLKLDRTLIQGFERDKDRRAMVVAALALARESGLTAGRRRDRDRPPAGARARAELLGRPGLPAAPARRARAAAPLRAARGGKVGDHGARSCDCAAPPATRRGGAEAPPARAVVEQRRERSSARPPRPRRQIVRDGMRVGLGTGTTVAYLLPALAERRLAICAAWPPRPRPSGRRARSG